MSMLVGWWDLDVRRRGAATHQSRHPSNLLIGVGVRMGTAHPLSPSTPWMNWGRVYDRMFGLMMPRGPS